MASRTGFRLGAYAVPHLVLPIGISFFTFHAILYVVDVYRGDADAQKSPVRGRAVPVPVSAADRGTDHPLPRDCEPARPSGRDERGIRGRRLPLHDRPRQESSDREHRRGCGGRDLRHARRAAHRGARLDRGDLLHAPDLLRLLRVLRHGDRPWRDVRIQVPGELQLPLRRAERPGVLAEVAHVALAAGFATTSMCRLAGIVSPRGVPM